MKRDRPTAEHLMIVFERNKGVAVRGTNINRALIADGHIHTGAALMNNLHWLMENGKIAKAGRGLYGIPNVRENGAQFLIVVQPDGSKREIEVKSQ